MIKKLRSALGRTAATRHREFGVLGQVDRAPGGNSIFEVGTLNDDGSWTKTVDGGHIVLSPDERDEAISALESHRPYQFIKVGDIVNGAHVYGAQYVNTSSDSRELRGTILAYDPNKREWIVWTANPQGELAFSTRTFDQQAALNAYSVRTTEHLYRYFNTMPPVLTFGHVAERDKLKSEA